MRRSPRPADGTPASHPSRATTARWRGHRQVWGVGGLCLLQGTAWVLAQAWPSELGYPLAGCLHFALIGCVAAVVALRGRWRIPLRLSAGIAAAGLCLFVLPTMVLTFAAGAVSGVAGVGLFCAVPVMMVLGASSLGADGERLRGLLVPSVVALGGALLLFPVEMPGSLRRWMFFGLVVGCCVLVAVAGLWMHRLMQGVRIATAVAVIGLGGAVVLGLYGVTEGWPIVSARMVAGEAVRCVVFDLPVIWVTVWLMREVHPGRLSARFLLVPLVNLVEGYLLMRGPVELKAGLEMAAVLGGAVMLLVKDEPEELPGLRLR